MSLVISIVGKPNVGKSTLFNVLTKTRDAIVADFPGLTRDRKYGQGKHDGRSFIVIDTGGLSGEKEELDENMARQTEYAIEESDIVLFMVDGRGGLTASDQNIADKIRRLSKKTFLVVNKTDGIDARQAGNEFYTLGLGDPFLIAASHAKGTRQMLSTLLLTDTGSTEAGSDEDEVKVTDAGIRVAFVGRPNAGKSTLVNRLLGEERVLVQDRPGTTRDSIHIPFERNGQTYTLIDTAGVRRRKKVSEVVEKFSIIKTLQSIDKTHVVVMLLDASREISDQDMNLLSYILDSGRALVLTVNKWDGLDEYQRDNIRRAIDRQLGFVDFAPPIFISALHGSNVGLIYKAIIKAWQSSMRDLPTPRLTQILEDAVNAHTPPLVSGRRIKLRYAHQGGKNPPLIVIHGNQTSLLPTEYRRYLVRKFRSALGIQGTPMRLELKSSTNPYAGRVNELSRRQKSKRERMIRHNRQKKRKQRR